MIRRHRVRTATNATFAASSHCTVPAVLPSTSSYHLVFFTVGVLTLSCLERVRNKLLFPRPFELWQQWLANILGCTKRICIVIWKGSFKSNALTKKSSLVLYRPQQCIYHTSRHITRNTSITHTLDWLNIWKGISEVKFWKSLPLYTLQSQTLSF